MSAMHDFWVNVVGVDKPKLPNSKGVTGDLATDAAQAAAGGKAGGKVRCPLFFPSLFVSH
jgi:hypothetical protein